MERRGKLESECQGLCDLSRPVRQNDEVNDVEK